MYNTCSCPCSNHIIMICFRCAVLCYISLLWSLLKMLNSWVHSCVKSPTFSQCIWLSTSPQQLNLQTEVRDKLHQRILYKLYTIVYKCIHGAAPSYLTNLCVPATNTSRRYLRSATHGDLLVPRMRTVTYGPRSFLFLVLLSGILCHRPYVYRPLHLESFRVD